MRYVILIALLAGCSTGQPNHLGNPIFWPITGVSTAAENLIYNQRRKKVKTYVIDNFDLIQRDMAAGGGDTLDQAMTLANVKGARRTSLVQELSQNAERYTTPEQIVVALMVHGN